MSNITHPAVNWTDVALAWDRHIDDVECHSTDATQALVAGVSFERATGCSSSPPDRAVLVDLVAVGWSDGNGRAQ